jgi:hypothetical protein
LLFLIAIVAFPVAASAQASPETTLKSFYKWYMHELNANHVPQRSTKAGTASSARLKHWFTTKAGREWDADYFIDAQDFDKSWETNIATSNAAINGTHADVTVTLGTKTSSKDGFMQTLNIKMVKEGGAWKIDRVNGH